MSSAMAEILRRFTRTVHELLYGKEDRLSRCDPDSPLAGRLELWPAS
jgi:hypothetical protein